MISLLKPWLWYLVLALIMCVIYCGLEKANGKLGKTTKSILISWGIVSCLVTGGLVTIQAYIESQRTILPIQVTGVPLGASCVTLIISSICVYSAA